MNVIDDKDDVTIKIAVVVMAFSASTANIQALGIDKLDNQKTILSKYIINLGNWYS